MNLCSKLVSLHHFFFVLSLLTLCTFAKAQTISAGFDHTLMLCPNGAVSSCGANNKGQLGDGSINSGYEPVLANILTDIIAVEAGGAHSLALKNNGTLRAWGTNGYGQLGTNGSNNINANPLVVLGLTDVVSMAAGISASIALTSNGDIWTWGFNGDGQLGQGNNTDVAIPTLVESINEVS